MRAVLWMIIAVDAIAAGVGFYVSMGTPQSVANVLQVMGGVGLLNAAVVAYLLTLSGRQLLGR